MRVLIPSDPYLPAGADLPWFRQGLWPCSWIACPGAGSPPFVTAYRLAFRAAQAARVRLHVAGDERYDLYLDGEWVGRGSERGAPDSWFFETYELDLTPGEHLLAARVYSLGPQSAQAQMSVHPGFLLGAEGAWLPALSTGLAPWEALLLPGYRFRDPGPARWRGARVAVDGASFAWGYERGQGAGWQPAEILKPAIGRLSSWEIYPEHFMRPATLPPMLNRPVAGGAVRFAAPVAAFDTLALPIRQAESDPAAVSAWQALLDHNQPISLPARAIWRVLIDLQEYYTAFPALVVSGGAGSAARLHWAESLFLQPDPRSWEKGTRGEVEGKYFIGFGDIFHPDGGARRRFDALWWNAGRYIELVIQTAAEPLQIEALRLTETRYPLEMESSFQSSDARLEAMLPLLVRGIQMCSNETFFDCPYYEELMYSGDTRLECLVTYALTRDDRLPRKALRMFDSSRLASGLTQARYPCRVPQIIAPFALWWVMMARDYAYWRADPDFIRAMLPGVRATLEGFERFLGADGLLYGPQGWNTFDWVPEWDSGVPPAGHQGASGPLNWQLIYTLLQGADLEMQLGDPLLAQRCLERALALAERVKRRFWNPARGLFADDLAQTCFSEHAQCLALLGESLYSGLLSDAEIGSLADGLLNDSDLSRATIYFNHYLFETYRELGRVDRLQERLALWDNLRGLDLKTPLEMPEPSRSDCHGWGAHPIYHFFATLLGIRPAEPGFRSVLIQPQLGSLTQARGSLPHPAGGEISVDFHLQADGLRCRVTLPPHLPARLVWGGQVVELGAGEQEFTLAPAF